MLGEQVEGAAHAAEHAEPEHVDLHELQLLDIVLLPFDDPAVDHRRRLDRNEIVEPVAGEDEAARMLAQVARRADQLAGQLERQRQARIASVEVELVDMALGTPSFDQPQIWPDRRRSRPRAGPAPCRPRAPRRGCGSG
jgi:hypothetical protein